VTVSEETSIGATPTRWANAHSLTSRSGLSPATVSKVEAMSVPTPFNGALPPPAYMSADLGVNRLKWIAFAIAW